MVVELFLSSFSISSIKKLWLLISKSFKNKIERERRNKEQESTYSDGEAMLLSFYRYFRLDSIVGIAASSQEIPKHERPFWFKECAWREMFRDRGCTRDRRLEYHNWPFLHRVRVRRERLQTLFEFWVQQLHKEETKLMWQMAPRAVNWGHVWNMHLRSLFALAS